MKIYVTAELNVNSVNQIMNEGDSEAVEVDFSPWANDIDTVTWVNEWGDANISSEVLTSSVASALISTGSRGFSVIEITGVSPTKGTKVIKLNIKSEDASGADYI